MSEVRDKIVAALGNERYDYRTAEGIAQETGIPLQAVKDVLASLGHIVRKSRIPDPQGRDLYALKRNVSQGTEFLRDISKFMSKST